ncbi:hypothetical protein VB735_17910 [Halotia wernerae UHCC 0503]|nr:hypothetical protein [Halotia wernerae UHCC 0503]
MSKFKVGVQPSIAVAISIALSCSGFSHPVNADPAILAPVAFCAGTAGIGCVLVGVAVVGGTAYYIWRASNGKHYVADASGNISNSERLVGTKKPFPLQSRAISGIDAAKLGDAHWADKITDCYRIGKRINKKLKRSAPAIGGGFWCIFPGQQTDFTN